jgi:hypothetical protein
MVWVLGNILHSATSQLTAINQRTIAAKRSKKAGAQDYQPIIFISKDGHRHPGVLDRRTGGVYYQPS